MEMLIGQIFRRGVIVTMERIHKYFSGVGKCEFSMLRFFSLILGILMKLSTMKKVEEMALSLCKFDRQKH